MHYVPATQQGALASKALLTVIGGVILLVAIALFTVNSAPPGNSYQATADRFITLISQSDGKNSYAMITDDYKKSGVGSLETWQRRLDTAFGKPHKTPKLLAIKPITDPANLYKNRDAHWAIYTVQLGATNWQISVLVLKDGASWKIGEVVSDAQ